METPGQFSVAINTLRNDGHNAPYQVDVRPFHTYRSVEKNLQNVTRYSLKFRIENDPHQLDPLDFMAAEKEQPGTRDWWPAEDIRAYAEWLCVERSGFQSLRFVLSKKDADRMAAIAVELADDHQHANIESSFERSLCRQSDENISVDWEEKDIEVKAHGICHVDFDALFDVNDRVGYVSGSVGDTSGSVRYNNPLLDTNWIAGEAPTRLFPSSSSSDTLLHNADAAAKTSRYDGTVFSLVERLRNVEDVKRANGDQRSGTAY